MDLFSQLSQRMSRFNEAARAALEDDGQESESAVQAGSGSASITA
jgi:hypothetical protein